MGAILFAAEAEIRVRKSRTCTSLLCQWLICSLVSNVLYAELQDIVFLASGTKKGRLDEQISALTTQPTSVKPKTD